jgi:hypothetical protein
MSFNRSAAFLSIPAYLADRTNRRDKLILIRADHRGRIWCYDLASIHAIVLPASLSRASTLIAR